MRSDDGLRLLTESDEKIDARGCSHENNLIAGKKDLIVEGKRRIGRCAPGMLSRAGGDLFLFLREVLRQEKRVRSAAPVGDRRPIPAFTMLMKILGRPHMLGADRPIDCLAIVSIGARNSGRTANLPSGGGGSSAQPGSFRCRACVRSDTFWKVGCHFASRCVIARYI